MGYRVVICLAPTILTRDARAMVDRERGLAGVHSSRPREWFQRVTTCSWKESGRENASSIRSTRSLQTTLIDILADIDMLSATGGCCRVGSWSGNMNPVELAEAERPPAFYCPPSDPTKRDSHATTCGLRLIQPHSRCTTHGNTPQYGLSLTAAGSDDS